MVNRQRIVFSYFPSVYSIVTNQVERNFVLKDIFANADLIRENQMFDKLLKGLTIQPCEKFDNAFTNSVTILKLTYMLYHVTKFSNLVIYLSKL